MSFQVLEVSGDYFLFYCILHKKSCKQTVFTLIRRRILRRLNWSSLFAVVRRNWYRVYKGTKKKIKKSDQRLEGKTIIYHRTICARMLVSNDTSAHTTICSNKEN